MTKLNVIKIINHYQNLENNFVNISEEDVKTVQGWINSGLTNEDKLYIKLRDYGLI